MKLDRREALAALGGAGVLALAGCNPFRPKLGPGLALTATSSKDPDVRFLDRFGFGPDAVQLTQIKKAGREAWFERQLEAPTGEVPALASRLAYLEIENLSAWDLRDWPIEDVLRQIQLSAVLRATYSPFQVRERLVHFWSDHFNVYARKGLGGFRKPTDERDVVRKHALGRFGEMVSASSKSTAMLLFLDQQASTARHPNENYARELFELHTLGVDGGYSQLDVMEAARCFTGWTEERGIFAQVGSFQFDATIHDTGSKTVLGTKIPAGGGVEDGEAVVWLAVRHPSTARHLAKKLCRSYLGPITDVAPVERVARTFADSEGDIKATMRALFREYESGSVAPVVKRPFDTVVSALRALGAETDGDGPLQEHLEKMGQPLHQWPMPDGFPVAAEAWTTSLLGRWNFAAALAHGRIKGTSVPSLPDTPSQTVSAVFGGGLPEDRARAIASKLGQAPDRETCLAACLSTPEFQWR
ncbi:MAG: DUF1800 domain-containing protein [Armatimonadetes bacterium]|nr:DUF1800 domain-containing protein [Armatimonadota bacterium]